MQKLFIVPMLLGLIFVGAGCSPRPCIKSHQETVTIPTRTTYTTSTKKVNGKTVTTRIPVVTPARTTTKTVCDQYAAQ